MDYWAVTAGCFAGLSWAISFYEIIRHLSNFTKPYLQRYIIRILLMVPIYSANAWIAMVLPSTGLYLDSLREVYESYVIYSFMKYLLNFLNYDTNLQQYIDHKPGPSQIFPFCFLPRCVGGRQFLIKCKHGILQYVVIRPLTTLIAFTSQLLGFYGEGNYDPLSGYVYPVLLLVNNASQITAMYNLVLFYTGYQHELRPMRPLAKFFSIKLVVFFSFFQSVVISALLEIEMVEQTMRQLFPDLPDKVAIGRKVQELLICFAMLLAAIGHLFAFPHKPFEEPDYLSPARFEADGDSWQSPANRRRQYFSREGSLYNESTSPLTGEQEAGAGPANHERSCCSALWNIFDFSEDSRDIKDHFSEILRKVKQTFGRAPALPAIVNSQPALNQDNSDEGLDGAAARGEGSAEALAANGAQRQASQSKEASQQSSGLGSTLTAGNESLNSAQQSLNSTAKNYHSID